MIARILAGRLSGALGTWVFVENHPGAGGVVGSAEIAKIARSPEMRERLLALGAEPVGSTPEEFAAVIGRDIAKWTPLAKTVGLKVD